MAADRVGVDWGERIGSSLTSKLWSLTQRPLRTPAPSPNTQVLSLDIQVLSPDDAGMKRTTLVLEDACIEAVRELAHRQGRQISDVVNELLVEGLRQRRVTAPAPPFSLPSYDMGQPRVDLADRDALEAAMDR